MLQRHKAFVHPAAQAEKVAARQKAQAEGTFKCLVEGCGKSCGSERSLGRHKALVHPAVQAEKEARQPVVASAENLAYFLGNCQWSQDFVNTPASSVEGDFLMDISADRVRDDVDALLDQSAEGSALLAEVDIPPRDVLVVIEAIAQGSGGLENGAATMQSVLRLARTAVWEVRAKGDDADASRARREVILAQKAVLSDSGSPLNIHIAMLFALLYLAGLTAAFKEYFDPEEHMD